MLFNIIQKLQLLWQFLNKTQFRFNIFGYFKLIPYNWLAVFPDGHLQWLSEFNEGNTIQLVLFSGGTVV
jgi:hypothetical protein